jgi:succinate dehydrogenase/fumarate reductase flavoprotein subunit
MRGEHSRYWFEMKAIAFVLSVSVLGCFGYNSSAKKWAYLGDTLLIAGGGGAIAYDLTTKPEACTGNNCPYVSPIRGGLIAGALLAGAGLFGIIFNATREPVKTSR